MDKFILNDNTCLLIWWLLIGFSAIIIYLAIFIVVLYSKIKKVNELNLHYENTVRDIDKRTSSSLNTFNDGNKKLSDDISIIQKIISKEPLFIGDTKSIESKMLSSYQSIDLNISGLQEAQQYICKQLENKIDKIHELAKKEEVFIPINKRNKKQ